MSTYIVRWWHPAKQQYHARKFTAPRAWQEATRFLGTMRQHQAVLLNEFGHLWTGLLNPEGQPIWTTEERVS